MRLVTRQRLGEVGLRRWDIPAFIGGLRLPFILFNFGWPGAKLTLHEKGVVLGWSSPIFRPFVPLRVFPFDDTDIQAVGRLRFSSGVRFYSRSLDTYAIFWTLARPQVLAVLNSASDNGNVTPVKLNVLLPVPSH